MVDLPRAVKDLVAAATSEVEPRSLRPVVEKVLSAFDDAGEPARDAALRALGRALAGVEGRGAQILCLALGALVESGASPELAWPGVTGNLADVLGRATAFATQTVKQAKNDDVEAAIEAAGALVAKKRPRDGDAWKALPSRCLTAVACLTRSKKLRARLRRDEELAVAAWPLSDVVPEVGFLLQALRIVDDETFLVLAPDVGHGWRVTIDAMPSNAELYVLLGDALIGDPKRGRLAGKRPDARAVAAIRTGGMPPKRASTVTLPFHLVTYRALKSDGSLPAANPDHTDAWIWMEGIPADIPSFGKERVIFVQPPPYTRPIPVAPPFEALTPDVRITEELSSDDVQRILRKLGKAAAHTHTASPKSAAKTKKGKAPVAKKAARAKKTRAKNTRA